MTAGYAVVKLFEQVDEVLGQTAHARHLIRAAFDLGFMTRWQKESPRLQLEELPRLTWRIGDFQYIYLPVINDDVLQEWIERQPPAISTVFITPPSMSILFDRAMHNGLKDSPAVMSLYDFLGLRLSFSSIDANWTRVDAVCELARAYNARLTEAGDDDALLIELPLDVRDKNRPKNVTVSRRYRAHVEFTGYSSIEVIAKNPKQARHNIKPEMVPLEQIKFDSEEFYITWLEDESGNVVWEESDGVHEA